MKAIVEEQFNSENVMTGTKIDIAFEDTDIMDLDTILAPVILEGLRKFKNSKRLGSPMISKEDVPAEYLKEVVLDNPHGLSDKDHDKLLKAWDWILDEMIFGFSHLYEDKGQEVYKREDDERAYNGIKLFGKYYGSLWN